EAKYNEFINLKFVNDLAARLGNDGVFFHTSTNIACNYINYKLNESLRKHHSYKYKRDYSIFKEFSREFSYQIYNNYHADSSCENYIEYLDNDIYNRISILYQIYYFYNELKSQNEYINTNSKGMLCDNINLLVRLSNDAINENKINNESISVIKILRK
ncbi:hypothetical protein PCYB_008250, partial [Plasmodium cynomolgi strain B]